MRNKLVFPSAGMETKYSWDKYSIQNNGIYKWDKYNLIQDMKYYWDKYSLLEEKTFYWYVYRGVLKTTYHWNRYTLYDIDSTFASNNFVEYVYNMEIKSKYLNLNKDFASTPVTKSSYAFTSGSYVYLYKADNTYVRYNISDVKNNCFTCNPLYYGFVGMSYDRSYSYPYYYFTPDTKMYVDSNNNDYLTFSNLYNSTRNISNKPTSLTDSPTGSYYIELNMMWPTTVKNIYVYEKATSNLSGSNRFTWNTYSVLYDMLNDGFWREDSYAVGYQYIDEDSLITYTADKANAYPIGISGDYLYVNYATSTYVKGEEYIKTVSSKDENAFPNNEIKNGLWYEPFDPGTHYWDTYQTAITKYIFDEYKYVATSPQKYVATKYELSAPGVTFKSPIQERDETTGEVYVSDYIEITLGELTDVYWPAGGRDSTNIAFWMNLDSTYDDNTTYSGSSIKPVSTVSLYTESLADYNNPIGEGSNVLYGKKMLDYTGAIGMGFSGSDYNRQYSYYLFTPETTWGRETGTGAIRFNNVRPMIFGSYVGGPDAPVNMDAGFGWEPGNTATTENKGCYVDYIHTIKREWNERFEDWRINYEKVESNVEITDTNPIFYKLPGYYFPTVGNFKYKDYENGYYYDIQNCYYNGEIGEYKGQRTSTSDLRNSYPSPLTSSTSYSYAYVLVDQEYGKGYQKVGEVSSRDIHTYPMDGMIEGDNSLYYVYSHFIEDEYEKGDFIETVMSTNEPNKYPQNNHQGNYWYIYKDSELHQYAGSYIESLQAESKLTYPTSGPFNGYWYDFTKYENQGPYKSRYVDEVETNSRNAYPDDGIEGNYWYVYKNSYEGYKLQINDSQIKGGIDYKHNINPEEDFTIGCVGSAEIDFDYHNVADDFEKYIAQDYFDYYTWQSNDNGWRLIGRFWIEDVKYNKTTASVKAFDAILATDAYVDTFIEETTFPITLTDFFYNLCDYIGVNGVIGDGIVNIGVSFADNFKSVNITARQIFQYIAEIAGGFIVANPNGEIILKSYAYNGKNLNNSNYLDYSRAKYVIEPISGVNVRVTDDDLGVSSGDVETNPYIIENNPLFYAEDESEIKPAINALYYNLKTKTYTPATIELLEDYGINCGDIVLVNNDTFYVMNKELSASGCKLECIGNKYRAKEASSINGDIIALRGKTNELYRDLETTRSTITDVANGLQSQITQTADEINLRVTNEVEGLESEISQTAGQISTRITNEVAGLESKITQTANSITSTVTDEINQAKSEIKQTTDSISLQVQNQGDLVAQLVLDVDGISAKGYVTFTDLAGTGKTTINGSNITTGTISADRINLKGAISWSDLDDDCQDTIIGYGGDTLPGYIKSTYIAETIIKSPTIYGGTLYAGNKYEGYCRMTSSGLNVVSDTGGDVCGIGWEPGYYNLPYLTLGQGVDSNKTNAGMIKKYTHGLWIGDNDSFGATNLQVPTSGTGIFIDFEEEKIYKYIDGVKTAL